MYDRKTNCIHCAVNATQLSEPEELLNFLLYHYDTIIDDITCAQKLTKNPEAVLAIRPGRPWPTQTRAWPTQTKFCPAYTTPVGLPKICLAL